MLKSAKGAEPEYELKHRITGAAILVAAAVLIIPVLLSGPDPEGQDDSRSPSTEASSRIVPLDLGEVQPAGGVGGDEDLPLGTVEDRQLALLDLTENGTDGNRQTASQAGEDPGGAAQDEPARPALVMTRIPDSPGKQSEGSAGADTAAEAQAEGGWVVRVGTFSKQANADRMSELLTRNGYEPRRTSLSTSEGRFTRVWLGPYAERETADGVSDRLKDLVGEKYVTRDSS